MSSADAPSAAVRTITPPPLRSRLLRMSFSRGALVVVEPARDAEAVAVRLVDDEAAGERDLGREPRALRLHRVLDRLHHDRLATADQVLDLLAVTLALELGRDDLVDVEEAVLLEADLDERGLHPRQDVVDGAEVDVPGDRAALGPFQIDLGDAVVLEDGDALLADVDGYEQLALRLRQRCARVAVRGAGVSASARAAATSASAPAASPSARPPRFSPRSPSWDGSVRRGYRGGVAALWCWWCLSVVPPRWAARCVTGWGTFAGAAASMGACSSDFFRRNQRKRNLLRARALQQRLGRRRGAGAANRDG